MTTRETEPQVAAIAEGAELARARRRTWLTLPRRHPLGAIGALILLLIGVVALASPVLAPASPTLQDLRGRLEPPLHTAASGTRYLLGTDQLGRDLASRLMYGARISLLIGFSSVVLTALIGVPLGLLAGFRGGWIDRVIMALVNLQLAFPFILLAIAIVALVGASVRNIIIVFAITSWPIYTRTVRAQIMNLRSLEFVEAARSVGVGDRRILLRHLLPHLTGPLVVIASFEVARLIIQEAALGFLGLSVRPPTPTWGNMLADGRQYVLDAWWIAAFPGLAITLTSAAVNFVGDALRDIFDPHSEFRY